MLHRPDGHHDDDYHPEDVREALEAFGRSQGLPADLPSVVEAYLGLQLAQTPSRVNRPKGPLRIMPADQGSGLSDVSVDHDQYLTAGLLERKMGRPG